MFRSMTSFSQRRVDVKNDNGERTVSVEIKSVNNKFLDLNLRIPRSLALLEPRIRELFTKSGVSRGKVDVNISCVKIYNGGPAPLKIDTDAAAAYICALRTLRDEFGLKDDISVMTVAQRQDLFTVEGADDDTDPETEWEFISPVLNEAVEAFLNERLREGENLRVDILKKLDGISELVDKVEKISLENADSLRERVTQKLRNILSDVNVSPDESRILTECAIIADRLAIDEELVRLRSHLLGLRKMTELNVPTGRKFDFQLQEVNREINTICSKCQNVDIASIGVELKNEAEKVREQIQNIE